MNRFRSVGTAALCAATLLFGTACSDKDTGKKTRETGTETSAVETAAAASEEEKTVETERTLPTVTMMTYETENNVNEGEYTFKIGTLDPIEFTDLETGLDLSVRFRGTVSFDADQEFDKDYIHEFAIPYNTARFQNILSMYPYSEFEDHQESVELGIASDFKDNLEGISNVKVEILEYELDVSCFNTYYDTIFGVDSSED